MKLTIYQADAFAESVFKGNPAAVVPLQSWLPDDVLQNIAAENNLAETAYFIPTDAGFHLRWFTPSIEVRLCGHATLATAHILFKHLGFKGDTIAFGSLSGILKVIKAKKDHYTLDFPTDQLRGGEEATATVEAILKTKPVALLRGRDDYMAILPSQSAVEALTPDYRAFKNLDARGLIATAKGDAVDFVSRCFFPEAGIEEDPVTGSAHTTMTPYWADVLKKTDMQAIQLSKRQGHLFCQLRRDRVLMTGKAVTYLKGSIFI
jgi:PhzF family phenazine biosynthesis protein